MIMGIDVGYSHTKVCTENGLDIFRSTVNEGAIDINVNSTKISFEGKDYTIGEKVGSFSVKLNKINDTIFRLCLYSAIARNLRNQRHCTAGWYRHRTQPGNHRGIERTDFQLLFPRQCCMGHYQL